jgi:hypothetical protein
MANFRNHATLSAACAALFFGVMPASANPKPTGGCLKMFIDEAREYTRANIPENKLRGGSVDSHVKWWMSTDAGKQSLQNTINTRRRAVPRKPSQKI